jgi:hypothetical protein
MCKVCAVCLGLLKTADTDSFFLEHDAVVKSARRRRSMCSNAYTKDVRFKFYAVYLADVPSNLSCRS